MTTIAIILCIAIWTISTCLALAARMFTARRDKTISEEADNSTEFGPYRTSGSAPVQVTAPKAVPAATTDYDLLVEWIRQSVNKSAHDRFVEDLVVIADSGDDVGILCTPFVAQKIRQELSEFMASAWRDVRPVMTNKSEKSDIQHKAERTAAVARVRSCLVGMARHWACSGVKIHVIDVAVEGAASLARCRITVPLKDGCHCIVINVRSDETESEHEPPTSD